MSLLGKIGGALKGVGKFAVKALPAAAGFALGGPAGAGIASKIGGLFKTPQGGVDIAKLIGVGGGIANMIGQGRQRRSAQNYANAQIASRNALLERVLTPPDLGITPRDGY